MAIDLKDSGLDVKISSSSSGDRKIVRSEDLIWDNDIDEGEYVAELVIVYPWKSVTKDTYTKAKDDTGKYVTDGSGKNVMIKLDNHTWHFTDIVFKIDGGIYDGYAVKGSLSTHPDMIGSAKRFLYNARLFDVSLSDLYKNTGCKVVVHIKKKDIQIKDKVTGNLSVENVPYVSYYGRVDGDSEESTSGN